MHNDLLFSDKSLSWIYKYGEYFVKYTRFRTSSAKSTQLHFEKAAVRNDSRTYGW